jgi:hypothetical protein
MWKQENVCFKKQFGKSWQFVLYSISCSPIALYEMVIMNDALGRTCSETIVTYSRIISSLTSVDAVQKH